jgi:hypothetical protein
MTVEPKSLENSVEDGEKQIKNSKQLQRQKSL